MTSKSFLQALSLIYFSLIVVMTSFLVIVLYLINTGSAEPQGDQQFALMLRYGLFVLVPAAGIVGYFVYKHLLASVDPSSTLAGKLGKLQGFVLVRSAFLEFPGLAAAATALVTADSSFLLIAAIMIVVLLLYRPTISRIAEDLRLSPEEVSILENPDSVLK